MKIRTTVKAGGISLNHNEGLRVRTALKAGRISLNHNEGLRVRSTLKAGALKRALRTSASEGDRLKLLVVRAGLRAGAMRVRARHRE